ncbi:hypothetical protein POTOM_000690 [Populus tomentosa]|uniref:Uncharacterized protein n=1 Tax=Populus tomentosa TaxID=118781 RepID=A0A8X8IUZ6_POPTO|nr:hypothetical protein POTOM_000690 [Populus tomentosa]
MEMLPALVDPRTGMRKIIDMFSSRMMRRRNGYKVDKLVLLLRGLNYPTHGAIVAERVGFECILNYVPQAAWSGWRHSITLEEYWVQTSIYHSHSASCLYTLFVIFALASCLDVVLCGSYIYSLYTDSRELIWSNSISKAPTYPFWLCNLVSVQVMKKNAYMGSCAALSIFDYECLFH